MPEREKARKRKKMQESKKAKKNARKQERDKEIYKRETHVHI